MRAMDDDRVDFAERAFIQQEVNTLARSQFATLVLSFDAFFPAADSTHRSVGNPNGVIWAGIAYSESGVPLDGRGLRLYAARRRRRTAPTTADHHCTAPDTAAV